MSLGSVCALVTGTPSRSDLLMQTREALAAQVLVPDHVVEAPLGTGLAQALATNAAWVWLLDGVTVPRPGALAGFEAGLERLVGLPEPLVLAGEVLAADGTMHRDALPRHELFEKELSVEACARGLVHLRAAASGSVLIRSSALAGVGPPRSDLAPSWAVFELTARLLRSWEDSGYLVPESVAVRQVPARAAGRAGGALRARARLLGSDAWTPTERLWEIYILAEATLKAVRAQAPRA